MVPCDWICNFQCETLCDFGQQSWKFLTFYKVLLPKISRLPPCMTKRVSFSMSRFELMPYLLQHLPKFDFSVFAFEAVWVSSDFMIAVLCFIDEIILFALSTFCNFSSHSSQPNNWARFLSRERLLTITIAAILLRNFVRFRRTFIWKS